jgi:membrane fusion protein, multidrug efflux system
LSPGRRVNFTEGQQVKTGDLLFRIEQATYKAAVEQQRANLAKAKATEVNAALQLGAARSLSARRCGRKCRTRRVF